MLDWQIKPLAKKSALGTDIKVGDIVVSAVYVDAAGNFDRADFVLSEFDESKIPGRVIGRWETKNPQLSRRKRGW